MALTKVTSSVIEPGSIESSSLEDSGVTSGQYGSASAIPILTVNQQGLVTAVSTANVGGLPDQTGESGNYLTTDGTTASWSTITQYTPPTDQGAGNFLAGDGTYKAVTVPTNVSELTNDSGYITGYTETNDLTSAVTWANVPDANITESSVTQHQASLSITESQISDFGTYNNYTDTDVASYLSANDFDTATNIIASITASAPTTLDTLNELAAALGDDPNFATTVSTNIGTKVSKSGDSITGQLTVGNSAYDGQGKMVVRSNGKNALIIQTPDNFLDRGISFRNGGGAYLSYINMEDVGSNLADMVFGVADYTESDVNNVEERMRITKDGNVCIGTSSPHSLAKLHVDGGSGNDSRFYVTTTDNANVAAVVISHDEGLQNGLTLSSDKTNAVAKITTNNSSFFPLVFEVRGSDGTNERMRIDPSGNVGIGTDSPSTKLDVDGTVTATAFSGDGSNLDINLTDLDDVVDFSAWKADPNGGLNIPSVLMWDTENYKWNAGGNTANWNTAYGWGDHASAGYLTSYTETDPIYTASSWYTTTNNSSNWDTAYSWGDHSTEGYATTAYVDTGLATKASLDDATALAIALG